MTSTVLHYRKLPLRAQRALLAHLAASGTYPTASKSVSTDARAPAMTFPNTFTHPVTGQVLGTGLTPSDDDVRDYPFKFSGRTPLYEMDFRNECTPIKNQGAAGSCTAFETVAHAERLVKLYGGSILDYSERANYNMSRALLGFTGDSGATLRAAIHAAYKFGLPAESSFPYSDAPAIINDLSIPPAVMSEANGNRFSAYYRLDYTQVDVFGDALYVNRLIDRALADGYTVGIGIWLSYWFYFVKGPLSTHAAVRHNPQSSNWDAIIGAHAMAIVGRSDSLGGYIVRNQWGEGWGDAGYYLMPFADTATAFEFWAVAGFDGNGAPAGAYDVNCNEAKAARLYRTILGRYADAGGLAYQTSAIGSSGILSVARAFLASGEYATKYGHPTDEQFVRTMYANALHIDLPTNDPGFQHQMQALAAGYDRAQMAVNFSECDQAKILP